MRTFLSKRDYFAVFASILLSVFMVAVVTYGATITISSGGVGSGTSTPGSAIGSKGAGIFEGFVSANYFTSTSSLDSWLMGNLGLGTTTPGAKLSVRGGALVDDFVMMSYFTATSTTATSTTRFGINLASSSLNIDGVTGRIAIGTTTFSDSDAGATWALDPSLTIGAVGSANTATATVYIAGEGETGGQLILKSSDGTRCGSIVFDSEAGAQGTAGVLIVEVVDCPR